MSDRKRPRFLSVLRSARTRAVLSLGIVLGLTSVSTLAFWTDEAVLNSGTIQSGTLDIQLNGANSHAATTFALANMIPGESVAYAVNVNRAANSIPFTYGVTGQTSATNAFAQALRFRVYTGSTNNQVTTNGVRTQTCTGTELSAAGGVGLVSGTSTSLITGRAALATPLAVSSTVYTDTICIQASLPSGTGNGAQGLSTTASFLFNATQLS